MTANKDYTGLEIAVVGLAGKFPGAPNIEAFWNNLASGKESIHFFTDQELQEKEVPQELLNNPNFVKATSTFEGAENFDNNFFNYLPQEARIMDPQIRVYHEVAWNALENAGYNPETYAGRIGLFAGASENITWKAYAMLNAEKEGVHNFSTDQLSNKDFLSTLVAYKLNLKGPAITLNTACSTSLVAIHTATRSLLTGECEMALAGGISLTSDIKRGYMFEEGMINSPDGHCRAFDQDAKGTIGGEGVGVVVLKKLKDALKDQDHIHAIIKGSAINNDGIRKVGYTSPSVEGQAECIKMAHKLGRVNPTTIGYVEAHGTGTTLGDPIEVDALNLAFNNPAPQTCALGAVKTNVGHLDAAAGVTGFIKAVLSLKHRKIVPSLHFNSPNPNINFAKGPFYVPTQLQEWVPQGNAPLRAAVSSFGIGGTNAHVVLEQAPAPAASSQSRPFHLLTLSARSQPALQQLATALENTLQNSQAPLSHMAYTLNLGRKDFAHRQVLVAQSTQQLQQALQNGQALPYRSNVYNGQYNPMVWLFSGQGTQHLQMGQELYNSYPRYAELLDQGFAYLQALDPQKDFKALLFAAPGAEAQAQVQSTDNAQVLLFLVEYALAKCLMELGLQPQYLIGHSLGEYTAACVAGVFSFEQGLMLVYHRGKLMAQQPTGSMLSVALNEQAVQAYTNENVSLAAVNGPEQTVLSGTTQAIEGVAAQMEQQGIKHKLLSTSHAFHSAMMQPMVQAFESICQSVSFQEPTLPVVSNLSGTVAQPGQLTQASYWAKHVLAPVRFYNGLETLFAQGKSMLMVEVGPGTTLVNLANKHPQASTLLQGRVNILPGAGTQQNSFESFATALANLWLLGKEINWQPYYQGLAPGRVPMPPYPFEQHQYPTQVNPFAQLGQMVQGPEQKQPMAKSFYQSSWVPTWLPPFVPQQSPQETYLLLGSTNALHSALQSQLQAQNARIIEVVQGPTFEQTGPNSYQLNGFEPKAFEQLLQSINQQQPLTKVLYAWGLETPPATQAVPAELATVKQQFKTLDFVCLLNLLQALEQSPQAQTVRLAYLSSAFQQVLPTETPAYTQATALGLLKVASMENPNLHCISIDLPANPGLEVAPALANMVLNELHNPELVHTVALRQGSRWLENYVHTPMPQNLAQQTKLRQKGVYLITGGLGKTGQAFAQYLTTQLQATVILLGRQQLPEQSTWAAVLQNPATDVLLKQKLSFLSSLQQQGHQVVYHQANLASFEAMQTLVQSLEQQHGTINGVIHAAGITSAAQSFKPIINTNVPFIVPHFEAKAFALENLVKLFSNRQLDFGWVTGSLSVVAGGYSLGAYMAANMYADYFLMAQQSSAQNGAANVWKILDLDGLDMEDQHPPQAIKIKKQDLLELFNISNAVPGPCRWIVALNNLQKRIEEGLLRVDNLEEANAEQPEQQAQQQLDRSTLLSPYVPPTSPNEQKMVALWQEFFGIDQIGIEDDFFELGGDSLKAMTLAKRIFKEFNVDIPLPDLMQNSRISLLVKELEMALKTQEIAQEQVEDEDLNELII